MEITIEIGEAGGMNAEKRRIGWKKVVATMLLITTIQPADKSIQYTV